MIRNRPASRAYGPALRTDADQGVGDQVRGAGLGHRRGQRDHPGDEHDRRPVDRPVGAVDARRPAAGPSRPPRAGPRRPTGRRRSRARRPSPTRMTIASLAPSPSGTTWRRTGPACRRRGGSDRRGSRRAPSTSPAGAGRRRRPGRPRRGPCPRPCAGSATTTRSPLSVTIPGKTVSPMNADRGGITTSARPEVRLDQGQSLVVEPVLVDERPGVPAEVGREPRAVRVGSSRSPNEQDDHDRRR